MASDSILDLNQGKGPKRSEGRAVEGKGAGWRLVLVLIGSEEKEVVVGWELG